MKTHLIKEANDFHASCTNKIWTRSENEGTNDYTKVTCLNCKKTNRYKLLKEQAEFKQETDKEMEEIKNEALKPKEWDKSKKYKVGDKVLIDGEEHEVVKNSDNDNNFCSNCINYSNHANCCTDCFKSIGESNRFKQVELQEPPKNSDINFGLKHSINNVATKQENSHATENKYIRNMKGVKVDVYDVLKAFEVTCPALQHLAKKALCAGIRGHKTTSQDLQDIIDSAVRAKELYDEKS